MSACTYTTPGGMGGGGGGVTEEGGKTEGKVEREGGGVT